MALQIFRQQATIPNLLRKTHTFRKLFARFERNLQASINLANQQVQASRLALVFQFFVFF